MKIKVIDMLVKMANDKNYKPTFKFERNTYKYNKETKYYEPSFMGLWKIYMILNDEVEIIEEQRKIEKIKQLNNVAGCKELIKLEDKQQINNHILKDKINELVDEINNLKEK